MNVKHRIKRVSCLLLALLLLCAMIPACLAGEASQSWEATILFTHDLHSHFLPQDTAEGGQSGIPTPFCWTGETSPSAR